jgi:hypothetical protein
MSDGRATASTPGSAGAARQMRSTQPMLITAMQLLDAFTSEQRQRAQLPFESDDRDNWDFLPASGRRGQQLLVHRLVGSVLAPEAGANHIHAVWRDPDGDFGRDLLLEHVAADHQGYDEGHVHDWRVEQVPAALRRPPTPPR